MQLPASIDEYPSGRDGLVLMDMLSEMQKLVATEKRVEEGLRLLRKGQLQVFSEVTDMRKDVANLRVATARAGLAADPMVARSLSQKSYASAPPRVVTPPPAVDKAPPPPAAASELAPAEPAVQEAEGVRGAPPRWQGEHEEGRSGPGGSCSEGEVESFVAPMLPPSWPTMVAMRHEFKDLSPASRSHTPGRSHSLARSMSRNASLLVDMGRSTSSQSGNSSWPFGLFYSWKSEEARSEGMMHKIMIRPNSVFRGLFDILGCIVLFYDLTVVPYALAWDVQLEGGLGVLAWVICLFWTFEMGTHFITGYIRGGTVQLSPGLVACHYLKTWFVPDLSLLTVDWLCLLVGAGAARLQGLPLVKFGRLIRLLIKWRSMKFVSILEDIVESSMDEFHRTSLRILLMLMGTLWLNHLICCTWFAVGRSAPTDTGMRWVYDAKEMGGVYMEFLEAPPSYQYASAFHWSLAQLASGEIEISCNNTLERLFNIVCLVIGLLFSSTLVSSLSAAMVDMQMRMREKRQKLMKLRRYLLENAVDRRVAVRVQQQAAERLGRKVRLMEQDVTAITLLSSSLRTQLRFEVCRPHLLSHPLFHLWMSMDQTVVKGLCADAIELAFLRNQDDLFTAGTVSNQAYYIIMGEVNYTQDPESSPVQEEERTPVRKGTWLSEASLWSHWMHVGSAEASTGCQVLRVSADGLVRTLSRHPSMHEIAREYCRQFHRRIISAKPPHARWPNDLQVPFTDYGDLVTSMDKNIQITIGLCALDQMAPQAASWRAFVRMPSLRGWDKLRDEVERGTSVIMMTGQGQLERVVSVVALQAEDAAGLVLAQLGKLNERGALVETACQLPGGKMQEGELTGEALQRVLQVKLGPLVNKLEFTGTERHVETKLSREHNVKTKYLRTVFLARLQSPMGQKAIALNGEGATAAATPSSELSALRSELMQRACYSILERGREVIYAWLWPSELDHLSSLDGEADLAWWLASLALEMEGLPEMRARHTHLEL